MSAGGRVIDRRGVFPAGDVIGRSKHLVEVVVGFFRNAEDLAA